MFEELIAELKLSPDQENKIADVVMYRRAFLDAKNKGESFRANKILFKIKKSFEILNDIERKITIKELRKADLIPELVEELVSMFDGELEL